MDKRNWIELSHALIQKSRIYALYSSLKSLPLQIFYTAVSSFSGPIALLLDKNITHQFILPENFINSIIVLNCKGELMKTISFNYRDRIVYMGFTGVEELVVVESTGDYWVIDAFSGQIVQGNYSPPDQKQEKYRGCELMPNNMLILLREKQLGYTQSLTSTWQPIPQAKIKLENPIFCPVFNSSQQFTYLSRQHAIQMYNLSTKKKTIIYSDSFLNEKWQNLLSISYNKQKNLLGLAFSKPQIIFYIDLLTNNHKKLDAMIQLKYDLSSSNTKGLSYKYVSKSFYRPTCYTMSWLNGKFLVEEDLEDLDTSILVFGNPKLLVMFDGKSTRLTPRSNCNQLISVETDCIRVYTEDSHEIYRIVPYLYQTIIEINKINEGYYIQRFRKIIELHDEFTNYLEKDIIDLSKLDSLWKMGNRSLEHSGGGFGKGKGKDGDGEEMCEEDGGIGGSLTDVNHFCINKENTEDVSERIGKVEDQIIKPLIRAVRYCVDPVDQVKMLKFIFFIKNLYTSPIDIYELCSQMRIVNNLKFQFLSRTMTINQFEYLKYEDKDRFLTILLRYKMHFIGDIIFKDSESKYKIFLHWAKCKIEKNSQAISFEEIKQKFENMPKKSRNSKVFTDIAKYSLDRGKLGLADKLIELQENPERKIMVYLLMLASTTDKKIVQKLINAAQECSRSFLIFRVIRELIESTWIQNHAWVNILYQKPNVSRHYVRYLKAHGKQELLKNYFFQNKDYESLGFYGVERMFEVAKGEQHEIPKYSQEALNSFIPKVEELKKFLPNLASVTKSFTKSSQMQILRKVKSTDYVPSEQEYRIIKNDTVFEYIGQILYQKQKLDDAVTALRKIKSQKVFNILMRKQRFKEAIQVASERKNKAALLEIKQKCPQQFEWLVDEQIQALNKK